MSPYTTPRTISHHSCTLSVRSAFVPVFNAITFGQELVSVRSVCARAARSLHTRHDEPHTLARSAASCHSPFHRQRPIAHDVRVSAEVVAILTGNVDAHITSDSHTHTQPLLVVVKTSPWVNLLATPPYRCRATRQHDHRLSSRRSQDAQSSHSIGRFCAHIWPNSNHRRRISTRSTTLTSTSRMEFEIGLVHI